jgi:hypothetical protein
MASSNYLRGRLKELAATGEIVNEDVGVEKNLLHHPCFLSR